MNINLDEYKEVKRSEYRQHKRKGNKEYAETLRFGFRYFIKKQTTFENNVYKIICTENDLNIIHKPSNNNLVFGAIGSLPLLKQAIESMEDE
jgi:hypothetical protein